MFNARVRPARSFNLIALLMVSGALLAPAASSAQSGSPPPAGTVGARPPADQFRWSLGAGVIAAPRPYVGADTEIRAIPVLELSAGRWYFQGIRAGYRLIDRESLDLDVRVRYRFSALDPEDSEFLAGMEERRETVEAGLGFDWEFARLGKGALELELRAFTDVLDRSDGFETSLDLAWRRVYGPGRVILMPAVGLVYQNANQVDYYYGVRPEESRPGRPAYEGRSVLNPRASLLTLYRFSRHWSLAALVSVDFFDDEIEASPIVEDSSELFGLVSLSYAF